MMKSILLLVISSLPIIASAQCSFWTEVPVDLGEDTTICPGQLLELDAGSSYDFYNWSNGGSAQSILVNSAGTYIIQTGAVSGNLIQFGDFEGGTTNTANNFTTDYLVGTGGTWGQLSTGGTYAINTDPSNTHTNFSSCGDHTTGTGNMLIANGSWTPNTIVWEQTVTVSQNTNYLFSFWAMNVVNSTAVSDLQLYINNVAIGPVNQTTTPCTWGQISDTWSSGTNTSAVLSIRNQSTVASGNDFAIDDIYFAEVCVVSDTIVVDVDPISVEAGPDITFCPNESETVTAVSNDANATFEWNSSIQNASFVPSVSGMQYVTATSQNGCSATDSMNATITPMNWSIDQVMSFPTDCGVNDGAVSVTTSGTFDVQPVYTWSGPGPNSTNQINATVFLNLSPGWYYLEIESDGCYMYDSIEVEVNNPPVADLSGSPISGVAPLSVAFTNMSQNATSYTWDFGNGMSTSANNMDSQSTVYDTAGVYTVMLIANQGGCADTAYMDILVLEPEETIPGEIIIPNVFTPNNDLTNDVYTFTMTGIKSIEVVIINRWGDVMFESSDVNFEWDGTTNGNKAKDGTYFYKYSAEDEMGEIHEGHGFLQLIRGKE